MRRPGGTTTETPIRLRLRLQKGPQAFDKATDITLRYLDTIARQYQVDIVKQRLGSVTSFEARSIGLTVNGMSSQHAIYVSLSEFLSISELEGRRRLALFLTYDGLLDLEVEIVRSSGDALPIIAVPDLVSSFARDDSIGLLDVGDDFRIVPSPISVTTEVDPLVQTALGNRRTRTLIMFGRNAPTSASMLNLLSRRVCGLASVVTMDNRSSFEKLNLALATGFEIPEDGMRVFGPIINLAEDPLRSTRAFLPELGDLDDPDSSITFPQRLMKELIWSAGRFSALALSLIPMPSWEQARHIIEFGPEVDGKNLVDAVHDARNAKNNFAETEVLALQGRVQELQENINALRETVTILIEEKAFEEQVALSWKTTAERQKLDIERLSAGSVVSEAMTGMSLNWKRVVEALLLEAVEATEQSQAIGDLRDTIAIISSQYRNLEQRARSSKLEYVISPPLPNDSSSLAIYLSEKYPGRFALLGQGARSYKSASSYANPARFLLALDILGGSYFDWKTASPDAMAESRESFEQRCREASLKTSPSATPQGLAAFPEDHTIRLISGMKVPMYELRDHGTTMEGRHMLYIGFVWDPTCGQIILGRFDHPPTLSMHT